MYFKKLHTIIINCRWKINKEVRLADIVTKAEKFLLILTAAALAFSAIGSLLPQPTTELRPAYQSVSAPAQPKAKDSLWLDRTESIDLNHASAKELETLPGIGETLAKRIVAYRTQHGPFQRVEDLMKVDGVHESTLNEILAVATVRK